jgi:crotonobetainyl-CoA:carnitine CoA-transferase CaiB-like acyl-CoA transferase
VDVSLLGVGLWSMGAAVALSLQLGVPWRPMPPGATAGNPLTGTYRTKDGGHVALTCLQPLRYWAEACEVLGRPELATDERFATMEGMAANGAEASELVAAAFAERTVEEWRGPLAGFSGQWTFVQDTLAAAADEQAVANGYLAGCESEAGTPFTLVAAPVQYGGVPAQPRRAPAFNEHGDAILEGLGLDWDTIVDLKVRGVVA